MEEDLLSGDRLTEEELASRWGVTRKTLQKWRTLGIGPIYIKIGAKTQYPHHAVIAFEKRRVYAGSGKRIHFEEAKNEK